MVRVGVLESAEAKTGKGDDELIAAPPNVASTEVVAAKVPGERPRESAENLREVWEHLVSHQTTRDIDGWVNCFAIDGVMEFPFRLKGVPARLEGREAIRAGLGPVWERAKKSNRRISGHEHVVFHQTTDPEVAIIEFDIVGENARGPFRQAVLYLLRARSGSVLLLRDFLDTAALSELFQVGS
jgi:ketosteroid isomerase-like protein